MILLFWTGLGLTLYTLAGWPLLLGLWSRWRARPVQRHFTPRTVTVIIAVHNGAAYLRRKLDSVFALDYPPELLQVLVVSDGSTDDTDRIAEAEPRVQLLRTPKGGKCRALNAAIPEASGELLLLTDVRQELDPACLRELVSYFSDPSVGAASGELLIRAGQTSGAQDVGLYWRLETWIRDRLGALDSMFGATGPIYVLRRELAVPIPEPILLDDMYLPLAAFRRGYRLVMAKGAIAWDVPTSRQTEFQRKIRTLAGNFQLLTYYPWLLWPGTNRLWFHFLSYKIARLLLPWLLLMTLAGSTALPSPANWFCWAGAAGALALAAAEPRLPARNPLRKIASPLRTFLTMMAAAVLALRVFWVEPRSLWIVTSARQDPRA